MDQNEASPNGSAPSEAAPQCERLSIVLHGQKSEIGYRAGDTILEAARRAGLRAPFVCLSGNCASCMAKVTDGEVSMAINHILSPDEVAQGYVLTCQALPQSRHVSLVFEE